MRTLFALFLLSFFASTYAATCDQNFPSVQIRAGSTQYFTDAVNNRGSYDIGVGLDSINFSSIY